MSELAAQSILLQLIVIIAVARLFASIARRCGQAEVVGEMLAGILLGPTLFGSLFPAAFSYVFAASNAPVFGGLGQIGLVLLMFQIGLDFELSAVTTAKRTVALVSGLGIVIPFALGAATSLYFLAVPPGPHPDATGFVLFFAVAMSITALPVLGRIFAETGLGKTRAGAIALSAAAISDVVGWILLGVVSLLVAGELSLSWVAIRIAGISAIGVAAWCIVRPLVRRFLGAQLARNGSLGPGSASIVLVLVFLCALATSKLGLHALIGGFILGVALHQHGAFVAQWKIWMGPLVNTLFVPIFFAQTGLRTDLGALHGSTEVLQCGLICAIAFAGKYGGGYLGARLAGEPPRVAHVLGVCMNTRGLMELVVLNVGYELGILPRAIFTELVYMAVGTTLIATPLIRRYLQYEKTR